MAKTKRVQILMDPAEFRVLEGLAHKRGSSVSDLMREAARAQLLDGVERSRRAAALRDFLGLPEVALPSWNELEQEIEGRRG